MSDRGREPIYVTDGDLLVPTERAAGPWFPGVQHGGAVAGLMARALEQLPSPQPMQLTRLTIDLSRRVPMEPVRVEARITRGGKRVQAAEVDLRVGDDVVSRGTALRVRLGEGVVETELLPPAHPDDATPTSPENGRVLRFDEGPFAFVRCFEMRRVGGVRPERDTLWLRFDHPLVEDEPVSPTVRACATADLVMSAGRILGFDRYTSANPDLSIMLNRLPEGPWISLECEVRLEPTGLGQSEAKLFDARHRFGRAVKSLLVDRR